MLGELGGDARIVRTDGATSSSPASTSWTPRSRSICSTMRDACSAKSLLLRSTTPNGRSCCGVASRSQTTATSSMWRRRSISRAFVAIWKSCSSRPCCVSATRHAPRRRRREPSPPSRSGRTGGGSSCARRYLAGRTADALATYQDARSALVEALGIEPGRDLQDLEAAALTHDSVRLRLSSDVIEPSWRLPPRRWRVRRQRSRAAPPRSDARDGTARVDRRTTGGRQVTTRARVRARRGFGRLDRSPRSTAASGSTWLRDVIDWVRGTPKVWSCSTTPDDSAPRGRGRARASSRGERQRFGLWSHAVHRSTWTCPFTCSRHSSCQTWMRPTMRSKLHPQCRHSTRSSMSWRRPRRCVHRTPRRSPRRAGGLPLTLRLPRPTPAPFRPPR